MDDFKHTIPVTAIIENEGKFLFIKRSRYAKNMAGKWVFPGGKVEKGEDLIQALFRELNEETGLDLKDEIAFLSSYQFLRAEDNSSSQGLVFLVRSNNREIKLDKSIEKYEWIKPEEIADFTFSYKSIEDFEKELKVTIPGMEVHVRNAIIALRKNALINRHLLSVTEYQEGKCSIDKDYFIQLQNCESLENFFTYDTIFPHL